jgi:hypothetical protein
MNTTPQNDDAKQRIIDEILSNAPPSCEIEVAFPSECKGYKLINPEAPITLRPMTFEDEKALASTPKGQDPVNALLSRCLNNLSISELFLMDKLYVLLKLREISYGDEYKTLVVCPQCKAENEMVIKLSELNVYPVPDDFTDPVDVHLPVIDKMAKVRLPRVKDEKFIESNNVLEQLWRFIPEIAGHTDKSLIASVVNKLPLKDSKTIINALKTPYGVDTKVKFSCNQCGGATIIDLPISASFFNVS